MSYLHQISSTGSLTAPDGLDVVFVHGIDGNWAKTWAFDNSNNSFVDAVKLYDVCLWSVEYDSAKSEWKGSSLPIFDEAIKLLALLKTNNIGARPVFFVTHSMGGLLVKKLFHYIWTTAKNDKYIVENTRGVYFIAVPHGGSKLATYAQLLSLIIQPGSASHDMEYQAASLRELSHWFRAEFNFLDMDLMVFAEELPTKGVMVVDIVSADPGIPGVAAIPAKANHNDITNPETEHGLIYRTLAADIKKHAGRGSRPPNIGLESEFYRKLMTAHTKDEYEIVVSELEQYINERTDSHPHVKVMLKKSKKLLNKYKTNALVDESDSYIIKNEIAVLTLFDYNDDLLFLLGDLLG